MGAKIAVFDFVPEENEQLEVQIRIPEEHRSVIHGVVKDCNDRCVKDAVVKLFLVENCADPSALKSITHAFTDECGQFLFGPLCPGRQYVLKVWYDNVKKRKLKFPAENCVDVCITLDDDAFGENLSYVESD